MRPAQPFSFAIVAALASLAGPASHAGSAEAASPRTCFLRHDINGFNAPDDKTVYLRVGVRKLYRLDLMGTCTGLSFREGFALEDRPASPWICSPLEATVIFRDHGVTERCPVTAIHALTDDEAKALPKRQRP
jgi:hypothetical protein